MENLLIWCIVIKIQKICEVKLCQKMQQNNIMNTYVQNAEQK